MKITITIRRLIRAYTAIIVALSLNIGFTHANMQTDLQQGLEIKTIISNEMSQTNAAIEDIVVGLFELVPDKLSEIVLAAYDIDPDSIANIITAISNIDKTAAGTIADIITAISNKDKTEAGTIEDVLNLPAPEAGPPLALPPTPPSRNDKPIGVSPT